ncbi:MULTISPECIES: AAA family ATPase [Pelosinus]|uniref:Nuclease SbcCD subunit C n=1 Tax=Pelosinus fermentans B4 TaxID=1149862 RepID=I9B4A4_9FIRM|nr:MULTISPECIES: AAA family ATPase [Pelosinus]EIW19962.1 exonuclease SbcC [Pelosinus fermentans B4]EIW21181.1 exonuclease SbcC [Pelosinus fermentans A11]
MSSIIQAVHLRGWQSHVDSSFHLGPGLNVITGPSDGGKTSIIRAVRWVAFNDPAGEAFINEAVGEAKVAITLTNGIIIEKRRRSGKTAYTLQAPGDEPKIFEKSEVPEDVKTVLGIIKHSFGDFAATLNFSFQLDAPFLISEPPSAGAKVLGRIAGTEVIDLAIKSVAKDNYRANQERLQTTKDIERIGKELKDFEDLETLKSQLEACEYLIEQVDAAAIRNDTLAKYEDTYIQVTTKITGLAQELDRLAIVDNLEIDILNMEKAQQRYDTLLGLYSRLGKLENSIADLTHKLDTYTGVDALLEEVSTLDKDCIKLSLLSNLSIVYKKYTEEVKKIKNVLDSTADLDIASELLGGVKATELKLSKLQKLAITYQENTACITRYQNAVNVTAGVADAGELLAALAASRERLQRLAGLKATYDVKRRTFTQASTDERSAVIMVDSCQQELKTVWASLKVCPLCEQPVKGAN